MIVLRFAQTGGGESVIFERGLYCGEVICAYRGGKASTQAGVCGLLKWMNVGKK